jgi:hypothetical protein
MSGKGFHFVILLMGLLVLSLASWAAPTNVAFILDASNSMNKPFESGSRIEAAKAALVELFGVLPEGLNVRLSVYGHRISKDDREASCSDIEPLFLLRPFNEAARKEMVAALQKVKAQGLTPLSEAVVRAANDLSALNGESAILLLSDGEETCGGEPLTVAKMLAAMTPPIILHIIGLDVDPKARETLMAMATATGGKYMGVHEVSSLSAALFSIIPQSTITCAPQIPSEYAGLGITNVIWGTEGDDILYGTSENDLIYGFSGNDFIIGLDGNDVLLGGNGDDILEGGQGNDLLIGGAGNDLLFGGPGNDILCGDQGNDALEGEAGDDCLDGGMGDDQLLGGAGTNCLYDGSGNNVLLEGKIAAGPCPYCPALPPACSPPLSTLPTCPPVISTTPSCPPVSTCPPVTSSCATPPAPVPICTVPSGAKSVDAGGSIQLHGAVSDSDCNIARIQWQADTGYFNDPTSLDPIYYAPSSSSCDGTTVQITLTATDTCGATASDSFRLHINGVNHPPLVDAGADLFVDECASVQLTCSASDPDGHALTYFWSVQCGRGTLDNPSLLQPVYTAPKTDQCNGEDVVLTLTVTDACGASACDSVLVHVRKLCDTPTVELGPNFVMNEGTARQIVPAIGQSRCGEILKYCWSATKGTFDSPYAVNPCYIAPLTDLCEGEDVILTLTVTNACGASMSDSVTIHVNNLNNPPEVKADP